MAKKQNQQRALVGNMRKLKINQVMPNVTIPTAMATSMVQRSTGDLIHTERICTQIATVSIGPQTQAGTTYAIKINPLLFPPTSRPRKIAGVFANYKIRKGAQITVRANLGTNINGDMTVGFSRNPDFEVLSGANASSTVFSLPGAVTANYWTPITIQLTFDQSRDWKILDADSSVEMLTAEGIVYIVVNTTPNVTSVQNMAVYLDCVIDFKGEQMNDIAPTAAIWPATTITSTAPPSIGVTGTVSLSVNVGEPAFPAMVTGRAYQLLPQLEVPVTSSGSPAIAELISYAGTAGQYFFWNSVEDYQNNDPLGVYFTPGLNVLTRSTINLGN